MTHRIRLALWILIAVLPMGCGSSGGTTTVPNPGGQVDAALYDYVLTRLNVLRKGVNPALPDFVRNTNMDNYAQAGTLDFISTGVPHAYFNANPQPCPTAIAPTFAAPPPGYILAGCAGSVRENQGFAGPGGATMANIDIILNGFMAEAPFSPCNSGGVSGHYDAIIDPVMNTVGIGLSVNAAGLLYMTIDFCD